MMSKLIDLKKYRIIDLSREMVPGVKSADEYVHGKELRRLELRRYIYKPDNTIMHWVDTESHIGTHVEGPSHYIRGGKDISSVPIEHFVGEAVVLNFTDKPPKNGKPQPITPADFEKAGVKKNDIVLMWSPYGRGEYPYLSVEGARWLRKTGIKLLGFQNIGVESPVAPPTPGFPGSMETPGLLKYDICLVELLANLDKIKNNRVFFIGLPIRIAGLDSSWIRAIALEEL